MNLTYQAVDGAGNRVQDLVEAGDVREAVEKLRRSGLMVTDIAPAGSADAPASKRAKSGPSRMPLKTTVFFTKQMAMLLKAGSGVVPALSAVRRQLRKPGHAAIVTDLIADLEEGTPLADAMSKHPRSFDPSYRAIVAAGEASATLPSMFDRLTGILVRRRAIRNKVVGALAYPLFLILMCTQVFTVLLLFIIPRFAVLFRTLRVELPASTAFLLGLSEWLRDYWPYLIAGLLVTLTGGIAAALSQTGRRFLTDIQTEVPLLGRMMSRLIQGQLFQTLGTLVECRVGLLDALELSRGVTTNRKFRKLMDDVEESVTSGHQISTALERSGFISPSIYHAVHTGEDSGNLGPAISFCADTLNEENTELISVATRLVEPMILIVMGFVVGTVALSLFVPLFDMTSAIK